MSAISRFLRLLVITALSTLSIIQASPFSDPRTGGIFCQLDISGLSDGNFAPDSLDYPAHVSPSRVTCAHKLPRDADLVVGVDPAQLLAVTLVRWQARGPGCEVTVAARDAAGKGSAWAGQGAGTDASGDSHGPPADVITANRSNNSSGGDSDASQYGGDRTLAALGSATQGFEDMAAARAAAYEAPAPRAYPLSVLKQYQVVNDKVEFLPRAGTGGTPWVVHYAVTYFALAGSVAVFGTDRCRCGRSNSDDSRINSNNGSNSSDCEPVRLRASRLVYQGGLMLEAWVPPAARDTDTSYSHGGHQTGVQRPPRAATAVPDGLGNDTRDQAVGEYQQVSAYRNGTDNSADSDRSGAGPPLLPARPPVWSQVLSCVMRGPGQPLGMAADGSSCGPQLDLLPMTAAAWGLWRQRHPDTLVLKPSVVTPSGTCASAPLPLPTPDGSDRFQTSPDLAFASRFNAKVPPFSMLAHHPKAPTYVLPLRAVASVSAGRMVESACLGGGGQMLPGGDFNGTVTTGGAGARQLEEAASNEQGLEPGANGTAAVTGASDALEEWALLVPVEDLLQASMQARSGLSAEVSLAVTGGIRGIAALNLPRSIFGPWSAPPMVITAARWLGDTTSGSSSAAAADFHGSSLVVSAFSSTLAPAGTNDSTVPLMTTGRNGPPPASPAAQANGRELPADLSTSRPDEPLTKGSTLAAAGLEGGTALEGAGDPLGTIVLHFVACGSTITSAPAQNGSDGRPSPEMIPPGSPAMEPEGRAAATCADGTAAIMQDLETGSVWDMLTGLALRGPLAGHSLLPLPGFTCHWHVAGASFDHYAVLQPGAVVASAVADEGPNPAAPVLWAFNSSFVVVDMLSWHLRSQDRWQPWMFGFLAVAAVMLLAPWPALALFYSRKSCAAHRRRVLLAWTVVTVAAAVGGWQCYKSRLVKDKLGQERDAAAAVLLLGGGTYWVLAAALMGAGAWLCHPWTRGRYALTRKQRSTSTPEQVDAGGKDGQGPSAQSLLPDSVVDADDVLASVTINLPLTNLPPVQWSAGNPILASPICHDADEPSSERRDLLGPLRGASYMAEIFGVESPLMMRGRFTDVDGPDVAEDGSPMSARTRKYLWRGDSEGQQGVLNVPATLPRLAIALPAEEECGDGGGSVHAKSPLEEVMDWLALPRGGGEWDACSEADTVASQPQVVTVAVQGKHGTVAEASSGDATAAGGPHQGEDLVDGTAPGGGGCREGIVSGEGANMDDIFGAQEWAAWGLAISAASLSHESSDDEDGKGLGVVASAGPRLQEVELQRQQARPLLRK